MRRRDLPAEPVPALPSAQEPLADPYLVGYQVLRRLGRGSRADVLLGSGSVPATNASGVRLAVKARPPVRAVKAIRPGVGETSIDVELDALSSTDSPHVVSLTDLGRTPRGQVCLVLDAVLGGSVAHRLAGEAGLAAGEGITVLASVLAGLEHLHEAGFTHGSLRADRVLVDAHGCPVLIGLGYATRASDLRTRSAFSPALEADRRAFAALTAAVLRGPRSIRVIDEVARLAGSDGADFFPRIESVLFDHAEPEPLGVFDDVRERTGPEEEGSITEREGSTTKAAEVVAFDWDGVEREARREAQAGMDAADAADPALDLLRSGLAGLRLQVVQRLTQVSGRHRRLALTTLSVATVIVVAAVLLLQPGSSAESRESQAPSSAVVAASRSAGEPTAVAPPSSGAPVPSSPPQGRADEPLAALAGAIESAGRQGIRASDYSHQQSWGDLAVLTGEARADTTKPPPILMERSGGGWVVRAVLGEAPGD